MRANGYNEKPLEHLLQEQTTELWESFAAASAEPAELRATRSRLSGQLARRIRAVRRIARTDAFRTAEAVHLLEARVRGLELELEEARRENRILREAVARATSHPVAPRTTKAEPMPEPSRSLQHNPLLSEASGLFRSTDAGTRQAVAGIIECLDAKVRSSDLVTLAVTAEEKLTSRQRAARILLSVVGNEVLRAVIVTELTRRVTHVPPIAVFGRGIDRLLDERWRTSLFPWTRAQPTSADSVAIVGALYVEAGFDACLRLLRRTAHEPLERARHEIESKGPDAFFSNKRILRDTLARRGVVATPVFSHCAARGTEGYRGNVEIPGVLRAEGFGQTPEQAEQAAAVEARILLDKRLRSGDTVRSSGRTPIRRVLA